MNTLCIVVLGLASITLVAGGKVVVEKLTEKPSNAMVTKAHSYDAMVTLFIENDDGSKTPSGWSTRKEHKGNGMLKS